MTERHVPVLLAEVMAALALRTGDIFVDATFGAGGYTRAALRRPIARAFAIDCDDTALRQNPLVDDRLTLVEGRYSQMDQMLCARSVDQVDAIAMDIGVSSMQLDVAERGFSFAHDGPLDMRMSASGVTAAEFINSVDERELGAILLRLGEEPKARRVARAIVNDRPLNRTGELAAIVRSVCGPSPSGRDPATKTFQAIRIHINDELGELEAGLRAAERLLRAGGRLAVVTFHSLEDRIVKTFFRERSGSAPAGSRHRPKAVSLEPTFAAVTKPCRPSAAEIEHNGRARSATLRAATRTTAAAWGTQ